MNSSTRVASHSGSWYDKNPIKLSKQLDQYLSSSNKYEEFQSLKSVIVPHSGLRYGGPVAAKAFININPDNYNRVVILGPSHFEYFKGCGLTSFDKFETPFGNVNADTSTINKLLVDSKNFFSFPQSCDVQEHSIEMEMPFLKYIFDKKPFSIAPMVVGDGDLNENIQLGKYLYDLYEDKKTLFVISSDFCHWGKDFDYTYYNKKFKNIWESTEDLDR
jgi:AmmeMemoRadiSam system protein B